jgi:hypothetical protein
MKSFAAVFSNSSFPAVDPEMSISTATWTGTPVRSSMKP